RRDGTGGRPDRRRTTADASFDLSRSRGLDHLGGAPPRILAPPGDRDLVHRDAREWIEPKAISPNGLWESIFQQDASYPGSADPNIAISAFFDRLGAKGGAASSDIWKSIFWLQQRPAEPSAESAYAHGRKGYLVEIQSQLMPATRLYNQL